MCESASVSKASRHDGHMLRAMFALSQTTIEVIGRRGDDDDNDNDDSNK